VFSSTTVLDKDGDPIPDPASLFKQPVNLANGGSPVLSDGSLRPDDLLRLLNQGKITVSEDEITAYRARLERDDRNASGTMARDRWYEDSASVPGNVVGGDNGDSPSERTRDARASALPLPNVQSLTPALQSLFSMSDRTKDDLYVPPLPPKPKPVPVPKPPVISAPRKPKPKPAPTPVKPKPAPTPVKPKPAPTPVWTPTTTPGVYRPPGVNSGPLR
jgi:hypothetical protein